VNKFVYDDSFWGDILTIYIRYFIWGGIIALSSCKLLDYYGLT
jgi:hypothetical protein